MYTCGRFTLLYSRNQHSTVKQLQTNLKKRWGKFFFIASLRDNAHSSLPSISLHPQMQALLTSEGWRTSGFQEQQSPEVSRSDLPRAIELVSDRGKLR